MREHLQNETNNDFNLLVLKQMSLMSPDRVSDGATEEKNKPTTFRSCSTIWGPYVSLPVTDNSSDR